MSFPLHAEVIAALTGNQIIYRGEKPPQTPPQLG